MSTFSKNKEGIVFPNCKERLNFKALQTERVWVIHGFPEKNRKYCFFSKYQISKVIVSRFSQGKHIIHFASDYNIELYWNVSVLYLPLILPGWQVGCIWSLSKTGDLVTYPSACYQIFLIQAAQKTETALYQNPKKPFFSPQNMNHKSSLQKLNNFAKFVFWRPAD